MSISIFNTKNNVRDNPPKAGFSFFNGIQLPLRGKERGGGDFCGFAAKKIEFLVSISCVKNILYICGCHQKRIVMDTSLNAQPATPEKENRAINT